MNASDIKDTLIDASQIPFSSIPTTRNNPCHVHQFDACKYHPRRPSGFILKFINLAVPCPAPPNGAMR